MFKKTDHLSEAVEAEQLKLLSELEGTDANSKEYSQIVEQLTKLDTVKIKKTHVSKDAVISASASILGILVVLNFERTGAIVSKAFGMIKKA